MGSPEQSTPEVANGTSRRGFIAGLATIAAALPLVAACTPSTPAPAATAKPAAGATAAPASGAAAAASPAAAAKPAGTPKMGGTLKLAVPVDVAALDPHIINPNVYETTWLAWDRLAQYDNQLKPQPMLAESWEQSTDLKRIKINLRKGVTFHSGRALTSADVAFNIARVKDPKSGAAASYRNQANWWTSVETPDANTVVLTSDQTRPAMFDFFQMLNIADKDVLEAADGKSRIGGTGPFALKQWQQGSGMTFEKNKNYWDASKVYLDGVQITVTKDPQGMVAGLEGGSYDVIKTPPLRDLARLKTDAKYTAITHPSSGQHFVLAANTLVPPLDNKKVRQALNWVADRKRFNDTILLGTGDARTLPWNSNAPAFDQSKNFFYSQNLDKAKQLLSEAGVTNLEIDLLTTPDLPEFGDFLQQYQADLAKVNIKANVKVMELAVWLDAVANTRTYRGMYLINSAFSQMEPFTLLTNSRGYDPNGNNSSFKNDQYISLVAQVSSEPDAAKRKVLYGQINDLLIDEAFALAVGPVTLRMVSRAAVKGITPVLTDAFLLTNAWIDA